MSLLLTVAGFLRDTVFAVAVLVALSVLMREGVGGLARKALSVLRQLHVVDALISWLLRREVRSFLKQIDPKSFSANGRPKRVQIPEKGEPLKYLCCLCNFTHDRNISRCAFEGAGRIQEGGV